MSFFDIAVNNIKKRFGSYSIYLISTIFAVTIFNIFCSIYYNPQFSQYRFGAGKMSVLFKASAIAVILFSSIFVFYANKFFLKTRKKEIAIYSLLGMKKSQIGRMFFYESIIMGIVAIAFGVVLGTVLARFFCMILLSLMGAGTKVTFTIKLQAIVTTVVAFLILFMINSLNAYSIIYRFRLIELLSASKEGEKTPKYSMLGGLLSLVLIATGYAIALTMDVNKGGLKLLLPALIIMLCEGIGSILFFKNFIPMLLLKLKSNKKIYYRTENFISISQIVYRIKANAYILSAIALLSAITITLMSSTYSLYKGFESVQMYYSPFSYMCKNIDDAQFERVVETVKQINDVKLTSSYRFKLVKIKGHNPQYSIQDANRPGMTFDGYVLSQVDYKNIIKITDVKAGELSNIKTDFNVSLNPSECFFIDGNTIKDYCVKLPGDTMTVDFLGKSAGYKVTGISLHKYIGLFELFKRPTIVLDDNTFKSYLAAADSKDVIGLTGLVFDKPKESEATVNALDAFIPVNTQIDAAVGIKNASFIGFYKSIFSLYGAYVFIGFFLGILFLLSTGSIIYYKQIIEAQEEVERYDILRKTGMSFKEVKQSVARQLGIVFGMPLLVGLMHSFFAILTYRRTMDLGGTELPLVLIALIIVAIYVVIYCFYYLLSVNNYLRIVWGKNER